MTEHEARTNPNCPVCGGDALDREYETHDDRYGYPGHFAVARCRSCGAGFIVNPLAEPKLGELYQRYYPPPPKAEVRRKGGLAVARHAFFHAVNRSPELAFEVRGGRVLDVGCGMGDSAAVVRLRGGSWVGLEADPRKVEAMCQAGLEAHGTSLAELATAQAEAFDAVLASQLLEHLAGPAQLFEPCRRLLRAGGRLVLSTPNFSSRYRARLGVRWLNNHVPYHQVYYTRRALEVACARHGFAVVRWRELTPATWRVQQMRYQAPAEGEPGQWYGRGIPFPALAIAGVWTRLTDLVFGDGDCIVAVLEKRGPGSSARGA
jgi:SAM-dependent methyltransferase